MKIKELHNLLKCCIDKRGRVLYKSIKQDPNKFFKTKCLLDEYLKYEYIFENEHTLYSALVKNNLLKYDTKHQDKNKCLICGNETKFTTFSQGYRKTCGKQECNLALGNKTNFKKYGVKNAFQSEVFKEKLKKTKTEKYGYCNFNNRKQARNTCLKKYGFENPSQVKEFKEKKITTNTLKYGVKWYNNIEKIKETNLYRYGVEIPFKNKQIYNKFKQTMISKYGFENPSQIKELKHKIRKYKEENGEWIPLENYSDFKLYKRQVLAYTRKNNLESLKNYNLRSNAFHLDHRYSIKQGFKDNIPTYIIGNICNLEIISSKDNSIKKDKCSITKEELFDLFY